MIVKVEKIQVWFLVGNLNSFIMYNDCFSMANLLEVSYNFFFTLHFRK